MQSRINTPETITTNDDTTMKKKSKSRLFRERNETLNDFKNEDRKLITNDYETLVTKQDSGPRETVQTIWLQPY